MNSGQRKTLERVFNDPIKSDIPWTDIEGLFRALGAEITEGSGSRVRIKLHGERAIFHRHHPEKTTDKGAVKAVRQFLTNVGVSL